MSAVAQQHRLDLVLPATRPLVAVDVAVVYLDREPEDIAMLIEQRYLRYAFDLRSERGEDGKLVRHAFPRLLAESVRDYARLSAAGDYRKLRENLWPATPLEAERETAATRRLIESLLPHKRATLRTPELVRLLSVTKEHINNLLRDGLLTATRPATINTPAEISRESVIAFLLQRRMPFTQPS